VARLIPVLEYKPVDVSTGTGEPGLTITPAQAIAAELAEAEHALLRAETGVEYAQALVNNREWARERVKHWVKVVDKAAGSDSTERFWSAVVASVLTGFEVANGCGLTNANVDRLLAFGVAQIRAMRGVVTESVRTAESLVADYINSNLRSMLAVNSDGGNLRYGSGAYAAGLDWSLVNPDTGRCWAR
jgi:hypothetical protein